MNDIEVERIRIQEGWLYITTIYKTVVYEMENYVDREPILVTTTILHDHRTNKTVDIGTHETVYKPSMKEK